MTFGVNLPFSFTRLNNQPKHCISFEVLTTESLTLGLSGMDDTTTTDLDMEQLLVISSVISASAVAVNPKTGTIRSKSFFSCNNDTEVMVMNYYTQRKNLQKTKFIFKLSSILSNCSFLFRLLLQSCFFWLRKTQH